MSGYYGYTMSNNAVMAYEDGERPFSKWTKSDIISAFSEAVKNGTVEPKVKVSDLEKLTAEEIRGELLYKSSWHHTSSHYNRTDFYSFDEERAGELTPDRISVIISERKPKKKETVFRISADIQYIVWTGTRKHPKKEVCRETVTFLSTDKMIYTKYGGNKRMTSITVLHEISRTEIEEDKQQ